MAPLFAPIGFVAWLLVGLSAHRLAKALPQEPMAPAVIEVRRREGLAAPEGTPPADGGVAALAALRNASGELAERRQLEAQVAALDVQLQRAAKAGQENSLRIAHLEDALGRTGMGPVQVLLRECPHQQAVAGVAGVLGLVSLVGPSGFISTFHTVIGAAVGGLLITSCASFYSADFTRPLQETETWMDSVITLVDGRANHEGYWVWLLLVVLALIRWRLKLRYTLCAFVDTLYLTVPDAVAENQRPLLEQGGRPRVQLPGVGPSSRV